MKNIIPRFHLAFPVHDLEEARRFYVDTIGCKIGRESDKWIDFDLYDIKFTIYGFLNRKKMVDFTRTGRTKNMTKRLIKRLIYLYR